MAETGSRRPRRTKAASSASHEEDVAREEAPAAVAAEASTPAPAAAAPGPSVEFEDGETHKRYEAIKRGGGQHGTHLAELQQIGRAHV